MKSNKIKVSERNFSDKTVCIAVSQWHNHITDKLLKGALKQLLQHGLKLESIILDEAPGSFELPLIAQRMIKSYQPDAVICLGCVVKGETPHFEFICQAAANGIMELNIIHNIPVIFGVLTTSNLKQANARSGGKHGNKGKEAALAALQMMTA